MALYRDCASYRERGSATLVHDISSPKNSILPTEKDLFASITYSSSSASSSTLGAAYLCRDSAPPVAICVSVAVVVALAGSGWPVVAAKVDCALALPILPDERLFFFFLAVCVLWLVSKNVFLPSEASKGLIRTHLMPSPDRFE